MSQRWTARRRGIRIRWGGREEEWLLWPFVLKRKFFSDAEAAVRIPWKKGKQKWVKSTIHVSYYIWTWERRMKEWMEKKECESTGKWSRGIDFMKWTSRLNIYVAETCDMDLLLMPSSSYSWFSLSFCLFYWDFSIRAWNRRHVGQDERRRRRLQCSVLSSCSILESDLIPLSRTTTGLVSNVSAKQNREDDVRDMQSVYPATEKGKQVVI